MFPSRSSALTIIIRRALSVDWGMTFCLISGSIFSTASFNELKLKGCDILADVLSNLTERVVTELELEDQNFVLDTPYLNILVGKNGLQEQELETLKAQYDPYITSSLMLFS